MDINLRLDLFVNNLIVVEIKTVDHILPVHDAQILSFMKLLKSPQGLILNFFTDNVTKSLKPYVNEYFEMLEDE